jgi:cytidylate kinase
VSSVRGQRHHRALGRLDRTQSGYARQFYGVDLKDSSLYHLVIDSTATETDACVEVIALAAGSFSHYA